jgi:hypothetical protein
VTLSKLELGIDKLVHLKVQFFWDNEKLQSIRHKILLYPMSKVSSRIQKYLLSSQDKFSLSLITILVMKENIIINLFLIWKYNNKFVLLDREYRYNKIALKIVFQWLAWYRKWKNLHLSEGDFSNLKANNYYLY